MKRIVLAVAAALVAGGLFIGQAGPASAETAVCVDLSPRNESGFYLIGSHTGGHVYVINADHSAQFGPFKSPTLVKITVAPGVQPKKIEHRGPFGIVWYHILLNSDPYVVDQNNHVAAC
jgi:hypothetical protein